MDRVDTAAAGAEAVGETRNLCRLSTAGRVAPHLYNWYSVYTAAAVNFVHQ